MRNQYHVHAVNKFPSEAGFEVESDQDFLTVKKAGQLFWKLARTHAGMIDVGSSYGSERAFDLAPTPKESRLRKDIDGKLSKDDKYDERLAGIKQFQDSDGMVLSCKELEAKGWKFDDKQKVQEQPKAG